MAPHKHAFPALPFTGNWHRPAVQRSMVGGMWMIDANFKSSIYIKNSVKVAPMTVTPILYLSNGRKFQLADVALEPAGIAVVNINQALADKGIAPWATLRGYVEIQYTWPWDALCVTIRNVDVLHSVILSHNLRPATQADASGGTASATRLRTYEGVWWKQEADVTGFVSVSNPSAAPISAKIQVSDSQSNALGSHTVTVSPYGTKVVDLIELQGTTATAGGVEVTYEGPEDALLLSGGLEDPATGYSANFQLRRPPKPSAKQTFLTYAELGLMTGEADPMMRFPTGTRFAPYFVARNLSGQAYSIQPRLYWMENSESRTLTLPQVSISPYATTNLNLASLISATSLANFNGSINLSFDLQGQPGALQLASGSVDQRNTYVFQVSTQAIGESAGKGLSYWSTANGDDTMITLWNPADEAQDFVFTLFFSDGHYKYPMHLGPKATRSFNISEIIQTQVPDDEGNVIPPSVHEGSAEIAGPEGETQPVLVAVDAGVFNAQKATCVPICIDCSGVASAFITANPFAVKVGGTIQQTFTLQYKSGTQSNATSAATWGSSNTSVGTVKAGLVTGVSAGSLNLSASLFVITQNGEVCQPEQDGAPSCGESLVSAPPAPGTSNPVIQTIAPNNGQVGGASQVSILGSGFGANPTVNVSPAG
ncbi:MAG TPA: Ig-like domain-containing protein [Candidatus Polarisedimenticolia bacterium]|nr:Ig-like domain-containing protein [Candidatus Polarisedimenticolia bacterium]